MEHLMILQEKVTPKLMIETNKRCLKYQYNNFEYPFEAFIKRICNFTSFV